MKMIWEKIVLFSFTNFLGSAWDLQVTAFQKINLIIVYLIQKH